MFDTAWTLGGNGAEEALALRREVFVEELGMEEGAVFDEMDALCAHLTVRDEGRAIASGRMRPENGSVRMEHICVKQPFRKKGYGDLCTRVMLDKARRMEVTRIYARVPEAYLTYYNLFGFRQEGDAADGYVPLSVTPDAIDWHPACGGDHH